MSKDILPGDLNSIFFRNKPGSSLKLVLFLLPLFLLAIVVFTIVMPSKLKKDSDSSVVAPVVKENKGFVGKSNALLLDLLLKENEGVSVRSVADLNKRYPAFEFMLPYDEAEGSNVEDVRLVGINTEHITDEKLRNFYYNSSLPSLLKKQRANMSERYFSISFTLEKVKAARRGREQHEVRVSRIYMKPDMFKVALENDLWKGAVVSAPNSLFDNCNSLYLVHKEMVMPLACVKRLGNLNMYTTVFGLDNGVFSDSRGKKFDYYLYYKEAFGKQPKHLRVDVRDGLDEESLGWLDIAYKNDDGRNVLQIVPNKDLVCRVAAPGAPLVTINPSEYAGDTGSSVDYKDGMRLLVYDRGGAKLTEFAVLAENPMRLLSAMSLSDEGYSRYYANEKNADVLTRQMTKGVCRNMSNSIGVDTVKLTVDPYLGLEFENEMKKYVKALKESSGFKHMPREQFEMSITIMDMATGNVLASPSVSDRKDPDGTYAMASRNSSFVRRPIGSTFKPLLTLACVLSNPSLQDLVNTHAKSHLTGNGQGNFLGHQTKAWVEGHWANGRNMTQYLAHSDDVYPVLLAALSLSGKSDKDILSKINTLPVGGDSYFKSSQLVLGNDAKDMTDYEMVQMLATLYSVHSFHENHMEEGNNLSLYMWEKMFDRKEYMEDSDEHFGLDEVSPDATNMRYDRFKDQLMRGHLVPWVLGQGDNDWSCIKMAEAWTRMLTKKAVKASFVAYDSENEVPDLVKVVAEKKKEANSSMSAAEVNRAWNNYLDSFRTAQSVSGGTLYAMHDAVAKMSTNVGRTSDPLLVLSKTGTPDEYKRLETKQLAGNNRYYDVAQFVFSLMPESSYKALKKRGDVKGITCVVRITRSYDNKASDNGMWSSNARNFFSSNPARLEKLYYMTQKYY